jgi:sugar phosphate isomerase/epimerase
MNPVTFSTLACPEWPIETVIAKAAEYGYDGIEWRGGGQGHVNPSLMAAQKQALRQQSQDAGLFALAVTAYSSFISPDRTEQQKNIDDLNRYTDLAAEIGARYVRAFLGELKPGQTIETVYPMMARSLEEAAAYAGSVGVTIAIEPHDDFVLSTTVAPLLKQIAPESFESLGVIWDLGNTYSEGEDVETGYGVLGPHLAYVQVKDGRGQGGGWQLDNVGEGEVPLAEAFSRLVANGYAGAFSLEWERVWHPELEPASVALPAACRTIRHLLAQVGQQQAV